MSALVDHQRDRLLRMLTRARLAHVLPAWRIDGMIDHCYRVWELEADGVVEPMTWPSAPRRPRDGDRSLWPVVTEGMTLDELAEKGLPT